MSCRAERPEASSQGAHTEPERPIRHGTATGYRKGCRCANCQGAKRARNTAYYAARSEQERQRNAVWRAAHSEQERQRKAAYRAAHSEEVQARKVAHYAANRESERRRKAAYRALHPERAAAYRAAHPEERRASVAAWHAAHSEQERQRKAAYRAAHLEAERERAAAYYAVHREQARKRDAAYRAAHPEERRAIRHRRRARLAGVESERFTLTDVIDRDGWKCGICGKRVEPGSKGRDRPSLDHIVPLALGGPHTLANAQLAHFGCNAAKGHRATIPAQLRMFG